MIYHFIYWIIIVVLAFAVSQYRKKAEAEKLKVVVWKEAYDEAKEAWASQSNAIREKALECGYLDKANKHLEKELKDLKKRLKDARIII